MSKQRGQRDTEGVEREPVEGGLPRFFQPHHGRGLLLLLPGFPACLGNGRLLQVRSPECVQMASPNPGHGGRQGSLGESRVFADGRAAFRVAAGQAQGSLQEGQAKQTEETEEATQEEEGKEKEAEIKCCPKGAEV